MILASTLTVSLAHAQTDSERGVARELWHEGDELQRAGRYADALEKFERAEKLVAAPTNVIKIAQCQAAIGELVEAAESYRLAHRMPLGPDAPAALVRAQDQAQQELTALEPHVPRLTLVIAPPHAEGLEIDVDGRPLNVAVAGEPIPLDPGAHRVLVRASGYRTFHRNIRLDDAEAKQLDVKLRTDAEGPEHDGGSDAPIAAYVSLGVGGVALLVGTITGAIAVSDKSSLSSACTGNVCPPSAEGDINGLQTSAWASNVAFGVGVVGVGVGAVLLLTRKGSPSSDSARHATSRIELGLGGLTGNF